MKAQYSIFPGGSGGKDSTCQCRRPRFDSWVGKIRWRRKWQSTPVVLPGKSHGQRSLVGYSPWGRKELDLTERLHFHFHFSMYSQQDLGVWEGKLTFEGMLALLLQERRHLSLSSGGHSKQSE